MDAVIYARQSLDRNGEGVAVARQLTRCRELAEEMGLTVVREFVDNDVSATRGQRPEFTTMMGYIRAGRISTVLVWDTDRLYRRLRDLVEIIDVAEKHTLTIATVRSGDIDLTTPAGRMLAGMLGSAARYEIEQKSARQVAANAQRAVNGAMHFAQRPYGYRRVEDGRIAIVEDEAAIIRESIARFVAGETWYSIAKSLKERGVVGISGRPFSGANLRQRVSKPTYAGIRVYKGEIVTEDGDWPPIIDKMLWARFQSETQLRARPTSSKKLKHLLTGIAVCGRCGATVKPNRYYKTRNEAGEATLVYCCRNLDLARIAAPIDAMVEDAIFHRLSQPDALGLLTPSEDTAHLAAQSRDLRERIDGLAQLYAEGSLPMAAVRIQRGKLDAELDLVQSRLMSINSGAALNALLSSKSIETFWRDSMPIRAKRSVVQALMTVTILPVGAGGSHEFRPDKIRIEWKQE